MQQAVGTDAPNVLKFGRVQYKLLAETDNYQEEFQCISHESRQTRVALMRAESDPHDGHGTILVSRNLADIGVDITHILYSGELKARAASMEGLLERFHFREGGDLFQTQDQLEETAYMEQENKIACTQQNISRRQQGILS